jgi:beta-glucosidase
VQDAAVSLVRPAIELKGFRQITLQPGEEKTVVFDMSVTELAFHDLKLRRVVEPGLFRAMMRA